MEIHETLASLVVPIDDVRPYAHNPRRGDLEAIKESLRQHGQYRPVVASVRTSEILAGNHTWQAAKALGWEHIAVSWVDVDDEEAARIVLVDNRTNDIAGYDDAALAELLSSLPDLTGTGYDGAFLAELLPGEEPAALTDVDAAAPVPKEDHTYRLGDVWHLGDSLLLVGDATDTDAVLAVLGDERADCVWTDPPYGVNYSGAAGQIKNDSSEDLPDLLSGAFRTIVTATRPGAPVYVAYADTEGPAFQTAMMSAGIRVRQHLVWVKNTLVLGHSDYQWRHDPIWAGHTPAEDKDFEDPTALTHEGLVYGYAPGGEGRLGRGGPGWYGGHDATTVFEVPKPPRNPDHPTMKPVELITRMLTNSCPPGGLVLDLFGGSGSTLIAAHHHRARAFLVELDERYADAICRRWQEHTGILPVREGEPIDFLADQEEP